MSAYRATVKPKQATEAPKRVKVAVFLYLNHYFHIKGNEQKACLYFMIKRRDE